MAAWSMRSSKRVDRLGLLSRASLAGLAGLGLLALVLAGCGARSARGVPDPGGAHDLGTDRDQGRPGADLTVGADLAPDLTVEDLGQPKPDLGPPDLGPQPDLGPDEGEFSLATYNVHNLFDTVDDPDVEDDVLTERELETKLAQLAAVIRDLDADILALQEVEHLELLELLFDGRLQDMGYTELRLIESTHIRGIDVAVVSRLPLDFVITHQNDSWRDNGRRYYFSPDCLEVRLTVGRRPVVIFINHLLSKLGGEEADAVREALGRRLRFLVDAAQQLVPGAMVAVVGDMNDTPDSPTLLAARGEGPNALMDLGNLVTVEDRYTYTYQGDRTRLDYILATPELGRQAILRDTRILHSADARAASDHSPMVTRFVW